MMVLFLRLILLATIFLPLSGLHAAESIVDWHSDIVVQEDSGMTVTETIRVRAEGEQIRRGIYRDFPTIYEGRHGQTVRIGFDLVSIERDGHPEPYHTERVKNGIRIYAGQEDIYLYPGNYTYTITYRTTRQLGYFEEHDELYWNVTGNEWSFPIEKASATVTLPPAIPAAQIRTEGYTGRSGSREGAFGSRVATDGRVHFETTRSLGPWEGLTIAVGWPKGHVAERTSAHRLWYFITDNRYMIVGLCGLVILLVYYFWAWDRAGRDPERGTIIPRFTPPDGLSPAAVRYIHKGGFDIKTLTAAMISLAVKRRIVIRKEERPAENTSLPEDHDSVVQKYHLDAGYVKKLIDITAGAIPSVSYTIQRLNMPVEKYKTPLSKGEKKLLDFLFDDDYGNLIVENTYRSGETISKASEILKKHLKGEYRSALIIENKNYSKIGILISSAVLTGFALCGGGPMLALCILPALFLIPVLMEFFQDVYEDGPKRSYKDKIRIMGSFNFKIIWAALMFFIIPVSTIKIIVKFSAYYNLTAILSFLFLAAAVTGINVVFFHLMQAPTKFGQKVLDKIEGFRMYLSTAEEHRLEMLHPPDKTPELFEKYLPYAIALEVGRLWSDKFTKVLHEATNASHPYSPEWYYGSDWDYRLPESFTSYLDSSFSGTIESAVTSFNKAPGTFSGLAAGGGFGGVGGGGGGGGGGGW